MDNILSTDLAVQRAARVTLKTGAKIKYFTALPKNFSQEIVHDLFDSLSYITSRVASTTSANHGVLHGASPPVTTRAITVVDHGQIGLF